MDVEARFMGARKTGRIGGWTRIKGRIPRRKKKVAKQKKVQFGW
jgi:hypothetical protein